MPRTLEERNYEAVAQTLEHHGRCMGKMNDQIQSLGVQIVSLKQELDQQRGLIVKSLQQNYGHGSTS